MSKDSKTTILGIAPPSLQPEIITSIFINVCILFVDSAKNPAKKSLLCYNKRHIVNQEIPIRELSKAISNFVSMLKP